MRGSWRCATSSSTSPSTAPAPPPSTSRCALLRKKGAPQLSRLWRPAGSAPPFTLAHTARCPLTRCRWLPRSSCTTLPCGRGTPSGSERRASFACLPGPGFVVVTARHQPGCSSFQAMLCLKHMCMLSGRPSPGPAGPQVCGGRAAAAHGPKGHGALVARGAGGGAGAASGGGGSARRRGRGGCGGAAGAV